MSKSERLYIRLAPELKERLQAAAEAEGRGVLGQKGSGHWRYL